MLAHAARAWPRECCGVMLGQPGSVTSALPLENAAAGSDAYAIGPADLLAASESARRSGLCLIGIYHSHPSAEPLFSAKDLRNSCPWLAFLILSVRDGVFESAACWLADPTQTRARREALEVTSG